MFADAEETTLYYEQQVHIRHAPSVIWRVQVVIAPTRPSGRNHVWRVLQMIVEPQNEYEAIIAGMMQMITARNLQTVDCHQNVDLLSGREACELTIRWSSGAVEQLSAYLAECVELEEG